MMNRVSSRARRNPGSTQLVVQSGVGLLAAFGLHFTPEQMAAVMTFTAALLAWWTGRSPSDPPSSSSAPSSS